MCSPAHSLAQLVHRATMKDGNLKLGGKIYEIYSKPDNAQVAEVLRAHPELFVGWIFLNPRATGNALEELEQWRAVPGFAGVKLHPHWHDWEIEEGVPILRRCEELGLPVLIHLGFGKQRRLATNRRRLPEAQSALRTCRHAALSAPMAAHARLPEPLPRSLEPLSR